MSTIEKGKHVLFVNTKTSEYKCAKLPRNQNMFLKPFSFDANILIGQKFGQKYCVEKHKLVKVQSGKVSDEPIENCSKTNEFICDKNDGTNQSLKQEDIERLKANGVTGDRIIKILVENSSSFNEKTQFSQAKWLKKKKAKHQPNILVLRPSIRFFCTSKVSKMRPDILGKIITNSNIWNGSKVIVVETKDDLLTSAVSQRILKDGTIIQIYEQKLPHMNYCRWLDLTESQMSLLKHYPLKHLYKLDPEDDNFADEIQKNNHGETAKDTETGVEFGKRKRDESSDFNNHIPVFEELQKCNFDSLIVSAHYDPLPVIEILWKCIRPSGRLVLQTDFLSVAIACANFVNVKGCSEMSMVDQWFREIQVLPGRTHPDMRMQTGGGFILTCTKIKDGFYEHGSSAPIPVVTLKKHIPEQCASLKENIHLEQGFSSEQTNNTEENMATE